MTYEKMLDKRNLLEKQIEQAKKQLRKCPAGKLVCAKNGSYVKWYDCKSSPPAYISKSKRNFAEALAKRKYLELQIKEFTKEKYAIDLFLKHSTKENYKHRLLLSSFGYDELLSPYFHNDSQKFKEWIDMPYESNPLYPEKLIHNIGFGKKVRSKSEMMIAHALTEYAIPFRYECALHLGFNTYYPDFTILRPYDEKIIYWEHFGLLDMADYRQNTYSKLKVYNEYNIFQGNQLITTFETSQTPLDYETVTKHIQLFLL